MKAQGSRDRSTTRGITPHTARYLSRTLIEIVLIATMLLNPFAGVLTAMESLETTATEGLGPVTDPADEPPGEQAVVPELSGDLQTPAVGATWTVTFRSGVQSTNADVVKTDVADGTLLAGLVPTFAGLPGYKFNGWSPAIAPGATVTANLEFTAQWIAEPLAGPTRDWTAALTAMGWAPPADAMRLTFNDVSQNKHTWLDYVYLILDENGDATLYFLAFSNNKTFTAPNSYMRYAGINGTRIANWNAPNNPKKEMYCIFRLDIPASLLESSVINGMTELYIVNEDNKPHSINGVRLVFTNISFVTEHWLYDDPDGLNLRLRATLPGVGEAGKLVTASPITIPGYSLTAVNATWGRTVTSGIVPEDGTRLVLRLYYLRGASFKWTIKGLIGDESTTVYNGEPQQLSDLLPPGTPYYDIEWPVDENEYRFMPAPAGDGTGVRLANPGGINVGTYTQSLELVAGYQVLFRPKDASAAWKPDSVIFDDAHTWQDPDTGLWWADIADEMGAALIIHGELTILPRPITITTNSAEKHWDGDALTKDGFAVTERDPGNPDETDVTKRLSWSGLLADQGHEVTLTVTGSATDVCAQQPNTYDDLRIFYTVQTEDDPYEVEVTHNYVVTDALGSLTVHPMVEYEANWPSGPGAQLGHAPYDQGGDKPSGSHGYSSGSSVAVLGNSGSDALSKIGYTFRGWAFSPTALTPDFAVDADGNSGQQAFTITANTTLCGVWQLNTDVSVRYLRNHAPDDAVFYDDMNLTFGSAYTVPGFAPGDSGWNAPTGQHFVGWFDNPAGEGDIVQDIDVLTYGTVLYAHYEANLYEVTYTYIGQVPPLAPPPGPLARISQICGATCTVAPVPSVPGYTFSGWTTADTTVVDGAFTMPDHDVTFVGSFDEIASFFVTYNGNGNTGGAAPTDTGGNAPDGSNFYYVDSPVVVLGKGTLVKTGYTFKGWATSAEAATAGTIALLPGQSFVIDQDVELFAVWEKNATKEGEEPEKPQPNKPNPGKSGTSGWPKTGDPSTIGTWLSMLGLALISLTSGVVIDRRHRRR